ncbi:MAG: hypothetical protein GX300_00150 [Tissierellia bacterium]|nr:hypothetical protein [Tissierellia bacterium]
MDNYRIKIRNRIILLLILFISMVSVYLVLFLNQDKLVKSSNDIVYFHGGVLTSFGILLILNVFKNLIAMKDEKKLKKLYIEEHDERSIMIMQKTGAIGINICIVGLGFATIIAGYFNKIAFLALLGATLFVSLVKGIFKIYYRSNL